jgi:hypothetical protein
LTVAEPIPESAVAAAAAIVEGDALPPSSQPQPQQYYQQRGRGGFGPRGRRFRPGQSAFSGPVVSKEELGEFDFTSSNSLFDKDKLKEEFEGPVAESTDAAAATTERPPAAKAYDK